jgi:hypothetical protein
MEEGERPRSGRKAGATRRASAPPAPPVAPEVPRSEPERLYYLGPGNYVQFSGRGDRPPELTRYMARHKGEEPPHMPLPSRPLEFHFIDERNEVIGRLAWRGKGPLPERVMKFVRAHGALPRYAFAADASLFRETSDKMGSTRRPRGSTGDSGTPVNRSERRKR